MNYEKAFKKLVQQIEREVCHAYHSKWLDERILGDLQSELKIVKEMSSEERMAKEYKKEHMGKYDAL